MKSSSYPSGPLCTPTSLHHDLAQLGVQPGQTLLLHSALSSLGFVSGGAETVLNTLLSLLTDTGTLVVPTHTSDNSDPGAWQAPPVPLEWQQIIRDTTPAYDPSRTRTRNMGRIAELFRTWPRVRRSDHPQTSFAAFGPNADQVCSGHELDSALGEKSPLGRMEDLRGWVLLLGVGWDKCTAFHLAEYRYRKRKSLTSPLIGNLKAQSDHQASLVDNSFAVMLNGKRQWYSVKDVRFQEHDFADIGRAFESAVSSDGVGLVKPGKVGAAHCRLFRLQEAVDFASEWMARHR